MKISSLLSAVIVTLAGVVGADKTPGRGICGVDRGVWSRKWYITLTNVNGDERGPICDRLWKGLKGRE